MAIEFDSALDWFAGVVIGTTIRGQRVVGVNLDIDTISRPEHQWRYIIMVRFDENPPPADAAPEDVLLARVFNEVPSFARYVTHDFQDLKDRLVGGKSIPEDEWILEDERA